MAPFRTLVIAVCSLLAASVGLLASRPATPAKAGAAADAACLECHDGADAVLTGHMATRAREAAFARRAFGADGDRFFAESCGGCHVASCSDCHGCTPHGSGRPGNEACLRCHRGYSAGWEYEGRAPREEHARYRRGAVSQGEPFLTMTPDVHHERGLSCADCHTMRSFREGRRAAKACRDCHDPDLATSPGHDPDGPMARVACASCHAAWEAQEYGTFLVRAPSAEQREAFAALPSLGPWKKSAALKRQDAPPLGLDEDGSVSPIRPHFVLFATDVARGRENRLLTAEWRPSAPHTIRRGTVGCEGCHGSRKRFLLEEASGRLYDLERDGLPLRSWWDREGQRMARGAFLPRDRFGNMSRRSPEYARLLVKRWQTFLEPDDPPSGR